MTDRRLGEGWALAPCTCGELVQGIAHGEPFLVSCPIDRYSRVGVVLGEGRDGQGDAPPSKARRAVRMTLELLRRRHEPFALSVSCPLCPSRGFGTSTADVVGAIAATAMAAGVPLPPEEVARLAVEIEPSDGTMFPGLALFAHRTGRGWEMLGPAPPLLVAVLEFEGDVDTLEYNAALDLELLRSAEPEHALALELLRRGIREGRPELMGQAATASARTNQRLLLKPALEKVIALGERCGALGVCAAHSGTVLGVLFLPVAVAAAERLLVDARRALPGLAGCWLSRMVDGGWRQPPGTPLPELLPPRRAESRTAALPACGAVVGRSRPVP